MVIMREPELDFIAKILLGKDCFAALAMTAYFVIARSGATKQSHGESRILTPQNQCVGLLVVCRNDFAGYLSPL
jgi:hypothetical protein